jgi:hypothetical protein
MGVRPPPGTNKLESLSWSGLSKSERPKSFGGCSGGCWSLQYRPAKQKATERSDKSQQMHRPVNRPIAAHFHLVDFEFAYFGEDFGEAICEPIVSRTDMAIRERTAQHQHEILSDEQRVDEPLVTSAQRSG